MSVSFTGVKKVESEHVANVIKHGRVKWLTHVFVAMIMNRTCAVDRESVFVGSVLVIRAAKSPTMLTKGSSANAGILTLISTEDYNVEVWPTQRHPLLNIMCHVFQEVIISNFFYYPR